MNKKIWIDPKILEWPLYGSSWSTAKTSSLERAYQIWHHAEKKANLESVSELDRVDIISNLKRCFNQRVKCLESTYKFNIFLNPSTKFNLKLLEQLGIIRPLLLRKLLELRNVIEHEDKKVPNLNRCKEFIDILWYFLKTTDTILIHIPTDVVFESPISNDSFSIDITIRQKWSIHAFGHIPLELISNEGDENYLELELDRVRKNYSVQPGEITGSSIFIRGIITVIPDKIYYVKRLLSCFVFNI